MAEIKKLEVYQPKLIQVHDHCPERPCVQLKVPNDAAEVRSVEFTLESRDQAVERPSNRSPLFTLKVLENNLGEKREQFSEHKDRWTSDDDDDDDDDENEGGALRRSWVQALRAGDVVQLIPRAKYPGWVNFVRKARICIEYITTTAIIGTGTTTEKSGKSQGSFTWPRYDKRLGEREIRLLHVHPAQSLDEKLELSWMVANLDDKDEEYWALSYAWGDVLDNVEVQMTDPSGATTKFHIGKTVEKALKRLRLDNHVLKIWIDAICINQNDKEERSQQVSLMRDVYSHAQEVHIWLGEDDKLPLRASFRVVRDIYNYNKRECPGGQHCSCEGIRHSVEWDSLIKEDDGRLAYLWILRDLLKTSHYDLTPAELEWAGYRSSPSLSMLLSTLFIQPWFSRVWVVQEAIVAKQAFVHYAADTLKWEEIVAVHKWVQDPEWTKHEDQARIAPIWEKLTEAHENTNENESTTQGSSPPTEGEGEGGGHTILDIFLDAHDLRASDPRDKLFALLAFGEETRGMKDLDTLIRPDYNKPAAQVFADFTRWWIKTYRSLDILSAIHSQTGRTWRRTSCHHLETGHPRDLQLPTEAWGFHTSCLPVGVISEIRGLTAKARRKISQRRHTESQSPEWKYPTWAVQEGGKSRWAKASLQAQFANFKASGNTEPNTHLVNSSRSSTLEEEDPLLLRLEGRRVSKILAIGHIPTERYLAASDDNKTTGSPELSRVIDGIMDPSCSNGFWTVKMHVPGEPEPYGYAQDEYHEHLRAHWDQLPGPKLKTLSLSDTGRLKWSKTDKLPACFEPVFFVTENGLEGLCPWTARRGDVVTILDGGKVPYLLRSSSRNGEEGQHSERFQFVGECYLENAMYGEYKKGQKEIFTLE